MTTSVGNVAEMITTTKMVTYIPFPVQSDESLPTRVARRIRAFCIDLLGPPMTDYQRVQRAISEWHYDRKYRYI